MSSCCQATLESARWAGMLTPSSPRHHVEVLAVGSEDGAKSAAQAVVESYQAPAAQSRSQPASTSSNSGNSNSPNKPPIAPSSLNASPSGNEKLRNGSQAPQKASSTVHQNAKSSKAPPSDGKQGNPRGNKGNAGASGSSSASVQRRSRSGGSALGLRSGGSTSEIEEMDDGMLDEPSGRRRGGQVSTSDEPRWGDAFTWKVWRGVPVSLIISSTACLLCLLL